MFATIRRSHFSLILALMVAIVAGVFLPFSIADAQNAPGSLTNTTPQGINIAADEGSDGGSIAASIIGWVLRPFVWAFRAIAGFFMVFASWILDESLVYSLERPLDSYLGIQIGWEVMRNFANLFFIFIILYIAIKTILQMGNHNTKQMLVRVIVVALLINFSAFFTKVVIDVGNVIAIGFYNRILVSPVANNANAGGPTQCSFPNGGNRPCTLGDRFKQAMNVQTLVMTEAANPRPNALQVSTTYLLTGIMYIAAGVLFLKAAFYFIARMIAFAFLIMFSPIAFLSYAVPNSQFSGFMGKWWSKLFGYTILAPAFMIIMYLVLQIISAGGFLSGGASSLEVVMNFILVLGLMYGGTNIAFGFADSAGHTIGKMGGSIARFGAGAAVGAVTAGSAYALRNTVGATGQRRSESKALNDSIAKGGVRGKFAQFRKNMYDKAAMGSFDVAQTKAGGTAIGAMGAGVPGFLQGGKGGVRKTGTAWHNLGGRGKISKEQADEYVKKAKELYPDDHAKQEEYLRNWMGKAETKEVGESGMYVAEDIYDSSKFKAVKDAKSEITRKTREKDAENDLKEGIKEMEDQGNTLANKRQELITATAAGNALAVGALNRDIRDIEAAIGTTQKNMQNSMKTVRPGAIAQFDEKILTSKSFAKIVDRNTLNEVHKQYMDGKYQDQDILNTVSTNVYASGNEKAKEYLASPEGRKSLMNYNVPRSKVGQTKEWAKRARRLRMLKSQFQKKTAELGLEQGKPVANQDQEKIYKAEDEITKKAEVIEKLQEELNTMLN